MKEIKFKNSSLQVAMMNAKKTDIFYKWAERALNKQPESLFWKEAFEFISKLHNKI